MTYLDNNVTNVAIPTIQRDLHLSIAGLEWVVSSYILVFAGLLLVGGRLADVYGRQRQRADRRAAGAGPRRRAHGADHAGHHRGHLHRPPGADPRGRRLGRDW